MIFSVNLKDGSLRPVPVPVLIPVPAPTPLPPVPAPINAAAAPLYLNLQSVDADGSFKVTWKMPRVLMLTKN